MVDANGTLRTVNKHNNPDLFWALRGGGNFGIITEMIVRTFKPRQFIINFRRFEVANCDQVLQKMNCSKKYGRIWYLVDEKSCLL